MFETGIIYSYPNYSPSEKIDSSSYYRNEIEFWVTFFLDHPVFGDCKFVVHVYNFNILGAESRVGPLVSSPVYI